MSARRTKPPLDAAQLKCRLAELLIEIDRVQADALKVDDVEIIAITECVAAQLARVLLPDDVVAAELRAAQAGLAIESPGLWSALRDVAARFHEAAASGRGIKVTDPAMSEATLAIARSTAVMQHPTGACCEGDGTFLRVRPDGTIASWSELAKGVLHGTIRAPRAAVKVRA